MRRGIRRFKIESEKAGKTASDGSGETESGKRINLSFRQRKRRKKMNSKMKESRRRYGITLGDIANKTFVPIDTLRAWEEGASSPRDRAAARRVAEMIKCDVSDLYSA